MEPGKQSVTAALLPSFTNVFRVEGILGSPGQPPALSPAAPAGGYSVYGGSKSVLWVFFFLSLLYFQGRKTETRDNEMETFPFHWFTLQCPGQGLGLGLGQAQSRSKELNLWVAGTQWLECSLDASQGACYQEAGLGKSQDST